LIGWSRFAVWLGQDGRQQKARANGGLKLLGGGAGYLAMRDTLQKHVPNLVAVLGTYACFAFTLGVVALSLYWVWG
jgi:hypothetical protein